MENLELRDAARLREGDRTDVSRTLLFAFVELPKFKKTEGELESALDRAFRNRASRGRFHSF